MKKENPLANSINLFISSQSEQQFYEGLKSRESQLTDTFHPDFQTQMIKMFVPIDVYIGDQPKSLLKKEGSQEETEDKRKRVLNMDSPKIQQLVQSQLELESLPLINFTPSQLDSNNQFQQNHPLKEKLETKIGAPEEAVVPQKSLSRFKELLNLIFSMRSFEGLLATLEEDETKLLIAILERKFGKNECSLEI